MKNQLVSSGFSGKLKNMKIWQMLNPVRGMTQMKWEKDKSELVRIQSNPIKTVITWLSGIWSRKYILLLWLSTKQSYNKFTQANRAGSDGKCDILIFYSRLVSF